MRVVQEEGGDAGEGWGGWWVGVGRPCRKTTKGKGSERGGRGGMSGITTPIPGVEGGRGGGGGGPPPPPPRDSLDEEK